MNQIFYRLSRLNGLIPLRVLAGLTNQKIIFPFYHIISNEDVIHIKHLYKIRNVEEFERDLDFLLKNFTPVDISFLPEYINSNRKSKRPYFLLSFDDGLSEFYDVVAPILLKKGIPAINFLNSGFIDNKALFYRYKLSIIIEKLKSSPLSKELLKNVEKWFNQNKLLFELSFSSLYKINYQNRYLLDELAVILEIDFNEYLKNIKPYMTKDQVDELIQKGFAFGAHSIDHPAYSDLEIEQQIFQTEKSIDKIIDTFKLEYKLFSFPFTDFNVSHDFFTHVYDSKNPVVDYTFGCAGIKKDSVTKNIQRIPIEIEHYTAGEVIYGEYIYFIIKTFLNKNTINRY